MKKRKKTGFSRQATLFFFIGLSSLLILSATVNDSSGEAEKTIPPEKSIDKISGNWIAPPEADKLKNPYKGNAEATAEGKKLYTQYCAICHGDKGKGDGIGGAALNPKPANFTLEKVQNQTDGAIYWKMTEGRPPMASYKEILKEEQRWQLVNYIRELEKNAK